MERIIMHIDVNNAFLSWTAVDLLKNGYKTDIRNDICVIGGDEKTRNGIVLAKSIPAKKCGIITAETIYSARKKTKSLKIFAPDYDLYTKMSAKLFELLIKYSPDIEIASIDECYLDYGKVKKLYGDEILFANKLKEQIKKELGFSVNIGIANNKLCAKMASDFSKPDQVHTCFDYEKEEKFNSLKVIELFGIGKKTAEKLNKIGIHTIKDLKEVENVKLSKFFKDVTRLKDLAFGINNDEVISEYNNPKGIGNEVTLSIDICDIEEIKKVLFSISQLVASRVRKENKYTNVICVTLKDDFFKRTTHQKTLKNPTNITKEIYNASVEILYEFYDGRNIRLIGIRADSLSDDKYYQTSFFENIKERDLDSKVDNIVDDINQKFGKNSINKASQFKKK